MRIVYASTRWGRHDTTGNARANPHRRPQRSPHRTNCRSHAVGDPVLYSVAAAFSPKM